MPLKTFAVHPLRASLDRMRVETDAGAAVQFALLGGVFITMALGVMFIGLLIFMGQTLDRATSLAARQIMTGAVQKQAMTQGTFLTTVVCPALPSAFDCSRLVVNVQTVPEAAGPNGYYSLVNSNQTALLVPALSSGTSQFSPGLQGNYEYVQVVYPITFLPTVLGSVFGSTTFNGAPAYLSVSTAAFRNEQY